MTKQNSNNMSNNFKWMYGHSWEKFPISHGKIWVDQFGSKIMVNDLTKNFPDFMMEADMIYCDPPWNLSNVNSFITKNGGGDYHTTFDQFYTALFEAIRKISARVCYLEIGNQYKEVFHNLLQKQYKYVQSWQITYNQKHQSFLLRASNDLIAHDFTGIDDLFSPEIAIRIENCQVIGDLCTGRGLTAVSAMKHGKQFLGIELNPRRMAVTIEKMTKLGSIFSIK